MDGGRSDGGPRPDPDRPVVRGDRAQAYTLEGAVGALLVLTALLFAVQSLVLTPTTAGAVDDGTRSGIEREAADALATAAGSGDLSRTVRYWNDSAVEGTFAGGVRPDVGYGNATPPTRFGAVLEDRFVERGYRINVEVAYLADPEGDPNSTRRERLQVVYQGVPSEDAVAATHPVTLFDDDRLTGPRGGNVTVASAHRDGVHPIPDVAPDGPLYNTLEVRLVVW